MVDIMPKYMIFAVEHCTFVWYGPSYTNLEPLIVRNPRENRNHLRQSNSSADVLITLHLLYPMLELSFTSVW